MGPRATPGPSRPAHLRWNLCFSDRALESEYQLYKSALVNEKFDSLCNTFSSVLQCLALRRQWGRVSLFDHLLLVVGIFVPIATQIHQARCPEAAFKRRFDMRGATKIVCLHITRWAGVCVSQAPCTDNGASACVKQDTYYMSVWHILLGNLMIVIRSC